MCTSQKSQNWEPAKARRAAAPAMRALDPETFTQVFPVSTSVHLPQARVETTALSSEDFLGVAHLSSVKVAVERAVPSQVTLAQASPAATHLPSAAAAISVQDLATAIRASVASTALAHSFSAKYVTETLHPLAAASAV